MREIMMKSKFRNVNMGIYLGNKQQATLWQFIIAPTRKH